MTVIAFLFLLLIGGTNNDKHKILWSHDYNLQWPDFTGPAKKTGSADALTAVSMEFLYEDDKPGIFVFFVKNKSWYIKKAASDYLLRHEQYHFHIAELYARKLRKQIIDSDLTKDMKKLEKAFMDNNREFNAAQRQYDKETNHSLNVEDQARWEKEVDRQLAEMVDYSSPIVIR